MWRINIALALSFVRSFVSLFVRRPRVTNLMESLPSSADQFREKTTTYISFSTVDSQGPVVQTNRIVINKSTDKGKLYTIC